MHGYTGAHKCTCTCTHHTHMHSLHRGTNTHTQTHTHTYIAGYYQKNAKLFMVNFCIRVSGCFVTYSNPTDISVM